MPGFRSDHVNLIAANLRDRYQSGFPILKELIQNADDAKASRLVFGYHGGFAGRSSHPLLQGPALWVLNDGEFKASDKRAIQSFGLNSKAGESAVIGKFGLGMKSVFHFCEAFFYVAFDGFENHGVILNPWFDPLDVDAFHSRWEDVPAEDFAHLHGLAASHRQIGRGKGYLQLWLPLRRREHLPQLNGKPAGAIVDKFPGDDPSQELSFLHESTLPSRIAAILPLLQSLATVEFAGNENAPGFALRLEPDLGSRRLDHKSHSMVLSGTVKDESRRKEVLKFYVRQSGGPSSPLFSELKSLDSWPKTMRESESGSREQVADKSEAEGAVMISHADAEFGRLQLRWAVFLPTEEGSQSFEASSTRGKRRYQIVLHGQFFVDAGRRGIAGFRHLAESQVAPRLDLDDADLHLAWNQAIAQLVVLPGVLPALSEYVEKHGLCDAEIEEISGLIYHAAPTEGGGARSNFCSIYREYLHSSHAWMCELLPTGRQWRLVETRRGLLFLKLPRPLAKDLGLPWAVMPALGEIPNAIYCDASASALVPQFDDWDENRLLKVLPVDFGADLCSRSGLEYLSDFLRSAEEVVLEAPRVQEALVQLIQRGLRARGLEAFRDVKTGVRGLVALVKPENRVTVGPTGHSADGAVDPRALDLLFSCETKMLLLPGDLDAAEARATGRPTDADLGAWLVAIDREISAHPPAGAAPFLKAASLVLGLCGPTGDAKAQEARARVVRMNRRARILPALDMQTGEENAESLESLEASHSRRRLFRRVAFSQTRSGRESFGHAKALSLVLSDERVLLISSEIAGILQQGGRPKVFPADDRVAVLEALGAPGEASNLSSLEARRALLKRVHQSDLEGDARRGLRYLLHGSPQGFMADQARLWIDPGKGGSPWIKLWKAIEPGSWFVLAGKLASDVPPNDWESLGISQVSESEVLRRLQGGIDFTTIDGGSFSDSERETILAAVGIQDVWRALPLHTDSDGSIGSVDANCFRNTGQAVPPQLAAGCRFIRQARSRDHGKKQLDWIEGWTAETTIRRALKSAKPQEYWNLILGEIGNRSGRLPGELEELRSVRWLPLAGGGVVSPEDVIDIEGVATEVDMLASRCGYPFAGISSLHTGVKAHPDFQSLRPLFSVRAEGLQRLGQLMSEVPGYSVGAIDSLEGRDLAAVAELLENSTTLPAWGIVTKAIRIFDAETVRDHLLAEIVLPLSVSDIAATLREISKLGADKRHLLSFNLYLRQLAPAGAEGRAELRHLKLLSKAGIWQEASRLCVGAAGVVRQSELDETQAGILAGLIVSNSATPAGAALANHVEPSASFLHGESLQECLEDYFRPWTDIMPSPPIGAFLSLLGPSARRLGTELLKPHSIGWLTEKLGWVDPGQESDGRWRWMSRLTVGEALDNLDPRVKVSGDSCVDVVTITGDGLSAELATEMETIFAGAFDWQGGYALNITLRSVPDLLDRAPQDLSHLLKRSALHLLQEAYNQWSEGLAQLWDELDKSDQLSLEVARDLILENLPFYLQQMKLAKRNPILSDALANLKRLQQEKSEARSANPTAYSAAERKVLEAKMQLGRLMVESDEVQSAVLSGVRDRVKESQYELSSIAFELFQNADDAVCEMHALQAGGGLMPIPPRTIGRFVVEEDGEVLRFIHWGRPINFAGHGSAGNSGYRDDLENMLILSASDKDGSGAVTGKFGLGFKSVLLATDSPRILSANLRAKVIGGCLPERWTGPEVECAMAAIERHWDAGGSRLRPTLIELNVESPTKREQILGRFEALAGVQAIFSKEIRRISVQGHEREWRPLHLVETAPSIAIGTIQLPAKDGSADCRVLVWRGPSAGVAMRLDSRGVIAFEGGSVHRLPSVWVTGPTRESPARGLILNADLEVDAGRGALAHGEGGGLNLDRVAGVARNFARDLKQVVQASRGDWEAVRGRLGLAQDVSAAAFWASFWKNAVQPALGDAESQSGELLHQFGIRVLRSFGALAREIPNGMPGDLASFVGLDEICLRVNSRWFPALAYLRKWPEIVARYPVKGWIEDSVAETLEAAKESVTDRQIPSLNVELIKSCIPNAHCSPETAAILFRVFADAHPFDQFQIDATLNALMFMAEDGSWQLAVDLLKDSAAPDEVLCLPFAAEAKRLNRGYSSSALEFLVERGARWVAVPSTIAEWILSATNPEARKAGLLYLLRGAQSYSVRVSLLAGLAGTWLDSIDVDSPVLSAFSLAERLQLVAMVNPEALDFPHEPEEPDTSTFRREVALEKIWEWWAEERHEHLLRYEKHFWPASIPRRFDDSDESRQSWMTLFALGLMQRMGRTRDFQHRGFIDFADARGWWEIFSEIPPQDNPEAWMSILKEHAEQPIADDRYIRWMDCFPRLYRMARWRREYAHVFMSLDKRTLPEVLAYLAPNEDPVLDGSDIHAPSLRNSLRLGQHLVVRELLRAGTLQSETARSLAYMPSSRVKRLLAQIGYNQMENSVEISQVLRSALGDRADFSGDFDIPLIVLAECTDLQFRVLNFREDDADFEDMDESESVETDDEFPV